MLQKKAISNCNLSVIGVPDIAEKAAKSLTGGAKSFIIEECRHIESLSAC
jgi:hypothetical protein